MAAAVMDVHVWRRTNTSTFLTSFIMVFVILREIKSDLVLFFSLISSGIYLL